MREFRVPHLRGEPTVRIVLTDIRTKCKRMPELQDFSLHIVDRLELLHDEVAKLNQSDPPRCTYVDIIEHLLILTRRKPLLVRLAKCETFALMFKELHRILDVAESGLHRNVAKMVKRSLRAGFSKTYRRLTKWTKKWESDRVEQISILTKFVENATDRQLVREVKDEKMVEKVLRELEQAVNEGVSGALLELTKVTFNRVLKFSKQQVQFVDWFISENDLLFDNVPAKMGTFGTVRSAWWFHDGECTRVMVKQIFPETSNNAEEMFFRELERWNNVVDNEHILKFYGGSHISKPRMFVCEYASSNISDVLNESNKKMFWPMFLEAARGLKALHTQGIVHGNLKCSNIIVTENKTVKLMDFGFDSVRTGAVLPNNNVATIIAAEVRWKPKEVLQFSDVAEQRFESDIYSLGMCMIEAIEKRAPFGSVTDAEVADMVMSGEKYHRPLSVTDASWNLIELLCDPDYTKRPTLNDVIEMIHNLIHIEQEETYTAVDAEVCCGETLETYEVTEVTEVTEVCGETTEISSELARAVISGVACATAVGFHERITKKDIFCSSCRELSDNSEQWCRYCGYAVKKVNEVYMRNQLTRHVKKYNKPEAWRKIYETAIDLQSLHDQDTIHANVKPANLCIGRDGKAHLLFLKPSRGDTTSTISDEDKLRWLAPECLRGGPSSQASDVYALGMCIIYVVSQAPPWGADVSDADVKLQVRDKHTVVPRPKGFSDDEWTLVERMCAYDSTSRIKIDEVVHELSKLMTVDGPDTPMWLLPREAVVLSEDSSFSNTPTVARYVGKWNDANVAIEKVKEVFDETKQRVQRVANLWFSLKHPTVLPLFGVCDDDKHPLFVTEYVERGDLSEYLHTTPLANDYTAWNTIWQVLLDVAFAIHYLHSVGIVHGDVRHHNMLVGRDGHGKLSGFLQSSKIGLESPEEEPTTGNEWRSSTCFCGRRVGFSSDVYWLGVCIISAFCLQPDSSTKSSQRICWSEDEVRPSNPTARCDQCTLNSLPDRPEGFRDEQWNLILDMCCSDPLDRVEMSDVVERLARLVAVNVAIEKKLRLKPELNLDQCTSQKVQTAMLEKIVRYEEDDDVFSDDEYDDYDDGYKEPKSCGLLLTAKTPKAMIQDGLDKLAEDAANEIFHDLEASLDNCKLTSKSPIFRNVGLGVHPPKQESYVEWHISSNNVVERKWDDKIGNGSFASVCRGMWFGAPVALKKLKKVDDGGRALREEANIWFRLRHPHIVSLFGACTTGNPLFVCELVDGKRLEDCNDASKKELWGYLFDAAVGLQGLHLHGVVHGDLKCDNILVTADGRAKLIDFGLSCLRSWGGEKPRGAIQWKAPEWLAGDGPTFESDIYGFGMCIVQALTGYYPWGRIPEEAVNVHVANGKLPKRPNCFNDNEWELVKRMCRKDPTIRPTIDDVVRKLGEFANKGQTKSR